MKNVVRVDRAIDAPLPPDAKNLDAVVIVLVYHDTVWLGVDRDKMNKAVFDALKQGGEYVIVDHSAADGHGTDDVKTLHRIDEDAVIREVERAGFQPRPGARISCATRTTAATGTTRRTRPADRRGTSDRFVLKFVRPIRLRPAAIARYHAWRGDGPR